MKNLIRRRIDRYFAGWVDRALDDAEPLAGWTAWYVRRRPELRRYYETMLEMELELRFADDGPERCENRADAPRRAGSRTEHAARRRTPLRFVAVCVLLLLCLCAAVLFLRPAVEPEARPTAAIETPAMPDDDKIDLGELFSSLLPPPAQARTETAPKKTTFETVFSMFSGDLADSLVPAEPIIRFSENPLERSLAFLETVHVASCKESDASR